MRQAVRLIKAVYENGLVRPVEPIEHKEGLLYYVTIVDLSKLLPTRSWEDLRGKYRGFISSSDEFARQKLQEKAREK